MTNLNITVKEANNMTDSKIYVSLVGRDDKPTMFLLGINSYVN